MMRMAVVLPAPLAPMNPTTCPLSRRKDTPRTACTAPKRAVQVLHFNDGGRGHGESSVWGRWESWVDGMDGSYGHDGFF